MLSQPDADRYQAAYCGLCRDLGKRYGFAARFLVSYDMTFLYLLLAGQQPETVARPCACPARCGGKKRCVCDGEGYRNVSAASVILGWHKLEDNVRDSGVLRGLGYRLLRLPLRRAYRKARAELPAFDTLTRDRLERLHQLEQQNSPSLDATADAFADLVRGCAPAGSVQSARPMQMLLYHVGRYIYLTDALDDLAEDCAKGQYNPLRFRFRTQEGRLSQEDLDYLTQLLDSSVNLAGSALALLELEWGESLLENILYLGLPAVLAAVKAGSFRASDRPSFHQLKGRNRHDRSL